MAEATRSSWTALPGIRPLTDLFGTFFVDQYGVLHDGQRPYPGAVETLQRLKASGRGVVLISNSGRSATYNAERLTGLGFDPGSWDHFVTSGDVALSLLTGGRIAVTPGPATRCLTVSGVGERNLADALGFGEAMEGEDADFVVIAGSRGDIVPLSTYRDLLAPAAVRRVPCICTNPDMIMLTPFGPRFGAGRIARLYEEMGGRVTWIGKPYPELYAHAAKLAGVTDPSTVICIGDSIEHDVVGAKRFRAASALVRTGIHAALGSEEIEAEGERHRVSPDYVLPSFQW
ncbi:TIGR01459 family HAD-type hydrolase [Chthonobacter albigriseus]|uniref:TIGR01459 family HAD-type hydrolase n=1 Tax=Chthonobacter albigriseus TaxID=1683161 RepID=UPI0015EF9D8C|nr:TIGR01459 family HAD-type hydrolase [Chthonobacter albigriseus]